MATATTPTPAIGPAVNDRFTLVGVSYATYLALADDFERAGRRYRLAFDRGTLEIMSPQYHHERYSYLLGRLVDAIAAGLRLPIVGAKSTTFRRDDLDRGAEPDECFYLSNEPAVRHSRTIDLNVDPPPDLVIEVDASRSSIDKLSLYAAFGVPELWRCDDGRIEIYRLDPGGAHSPLDASPALPFLTREVIEDWLRTRDATDQTSWFLAVMDWARDEVAPALGDQAEGRDEEAG